MLFHYLTFSLCEKIEIAQEDDCLAGRAPLTKETMIIRYIKHLIYLSLSHKSFHLAVGLGRILYNYSYSETSRMYEIGVAQSGDFNKSDVHYRDWKKIIFDKLRSRFEGFVTAVEKSRGERRFETCRGSGDLTRFVEACLSLFTPWGSCCVLPHTFCKGKMDVPALQSPQEGSNNFDPDDEHIIEKNRMHTIIHPCCFSRLVLALELDPPGSRLEVPGFFVSRDDDTEPGPPFDFDNLPQPPPEYFPDILERVLKQRTYRRVTSPRMLYIVVDGIELARFDVLDLRHSRVELDPEADIVRIFSKEKHGDLLLSTLSLKSSRVDEADRLWRSAIVLEGGQKISLRISPRSGSIEPRVMHLKYSETHPLRAIALFFERVKFKTAERPGISRPKLVFAISAALVFVVALSLYLLSHGHGPEQPEPDIAQQELTLEPQPANPLPEKASPKPQSDSGPNGTTASKPQAAESRAPASHYRPGRRRVQLEDAPLIAQTAPAHSFPSAERGTTSERVSLADVKTVFIELRMNDSLGQDIRGQLASALGTDGKVSPASSEQADAHLIISVYRDPKSTARGEQGVSVAARLINSSGRVIWPASGAQRAVRYSGLAEEIATRLMKDLVGEIEAAKRNR